MYCKDIHRLAMLSIEMYKVVVAVSKMLDAVYSN
jgi:hypothetical protein